MSRAARIMIGCLAVGLLVWRLDWAAIVGTWASADKLLIIVAVLLLVPSLLLLAARMVMLVHSCGGNLSFTRSLLILLAGNCTSTLLSAGTIAGDGLRMVLLAQAAGSRHAALIVVAADRLLGLAGLLCFPLAFAIWHVSVLGLNRIVILFMAIALVCTAAGCVWRLRNRMVTLVPGRFVPHIQRLGQSVSVLVGHRRTLATGLLIAVVSHALILAALLLAARALGGFTTMTIGTAAASMCLTALSLLASTLPFGVMEWCFAGLLGWQSGIMSPEVAVSVALFGRATQLLYGIPALAWLMWTASPNTHAHEPDGELA